MTERLRPSMVGTIYKKEVVDTLRDRRTLATMLLVPMVSYPLLVLFVSEVASVEQAAAASRQVAVRTLGPVPQPVLEAITSTASIRWAGAGAKVDSTKEGARALLVDEEIDVVLAASATAAAALEALGTAHLTIYFDETRPFAHQSVELVRERLTELALDLRDMRMAALDLDTATARPLSIRSRSIATSSQVGSQIASLYLPMLILFFVALSSFYPAVDLTAGEKERGTLATLLTAPIRPLEIVWGKYLAVVTIGTLAGLLNVAVISATLARAVSGGGDAVKASLPEVNLPMVLGLLIAVMVLAALIGAVMLVSATFARSFRDANNLLAPVLLVTMAPALLGVLPRVQLTPAMAAVPVANGVLLMKGLLTQNVQWSSAAVVVASTMAYTALLLALAARVFADERVLFSTEGRRADFSTLVLAPPAPGPGAAVAFAAMVFIGNYYGALLVTGLPAVLGVVCVQLAVHTGGALAFTRWLRQPFAEMLRLAPPLPIAFAAAALIGLGAWLGLSLPVLWLQDALLSGQAEAAESLKSSLGIDGVALPLLILSLAIVPALGEELVFRGAILGLLEKRWTPTSALIGQAVLFGLMHGSVFRFLPTALLGLVLGHLAKKTGSVWPGVLAHAMTNAIALSLDRLAPAMVERHLATPSALALAGLAILAAGLWLLRRGARDATTG